MIKDPIDNKNHFAPNLQKEHIGGFRFEDYIREVSQQGLDIHGICVRQHNQVLGQFHWWDGRRADINSCSKSVLSLALGIAIGEGYIGLDERIIDVLSRLAPENPSENLSKITVRHLITMTPGYAGYILPGWQRDWELDKDWAHYCLHQEVVNCPGEKFIYNNASAILTARAIQERTGEKLVDWLKPRLFEPLNIPNPQWHTCPLGYTAGTGGLFLNIEEMSRIGQLCLDNGVWEGKQLVPTDYIRTATSRQVSNEGHPMCSGPDDQSGYGYFFWMTQDPNTFDAYGMYGQHIYVFRKLDAVVTVAAHLEREEMRQRSFDALKKTILPQLNAD